MIKKEIYPKTKRVKIEGSKVYITEKLDGSNLCIFKKDDILYFAQRNNIITKDEMTKDLAYKGLMGWIEQNAKWLEDNLLNNAAICGEWLGMGCLKYDVGDFDKRFYMFAKANIDDDFNLIKIVYNQDNFKYPFAEQEIPDFIGKVPIVCELTLIPNKEHLDTIYDNYTKKVKRSVEGFVVNYQDIISKYVRMKNGTLQEHRDVFKKEEEIE